MTALPEWGEFDPFELPDWLGTGAVTWTATEAIGWGHRVTGELTGAGGAVACHLLAIDEACPEPVADQELRTASHQAWQHGEVLVIEVDGELTLAVPGRRFSADGVLEVIERLARAVAAHTTNYTVKLVVGRDASGAPDPSTMPE